MTLQTTRLRLRPFREDDVQAIYDSSVSPSAFAFLASSLMRSIRSCFIKFTQTG